MDVLSKLRSSILIAAPVLLLFAAVAQEPNPPTRAVRILYPATRTVHAGQLMLIAAAPKETARLSATLDGKPLLLRRLTFAPEWTLGGKLKPTADLVGDRSLTSLWATELTLAPGSHIAVIGGSRIEISAAKQPGTAAPTGFAPAYTHKPLTPGEGKIDCGSCHERKGETLGEVRTPQICASCHTETSVQLIHSHVPNPLERCATCHDPHGVARPKLLVDAKRTLCSRCHEPGHIK